MPRHANSRLEVRRVPTHRGKRLVHEDALGFQLRVTWETMRTALQERLVAHGTSFAHWSYLRILWASDGITQSELSDRVKRVGANTVSAINALQRAGLVRRVRSRVDRRTVYVHLTAVGRALERELVPLAAEVQRIAVRGIPAGDLAVFRRVLAGIRSNLGARR